MSETILTNARLVLRDEVVEGSLSIRNGRIASIGNGSAKGDDLEGDFLIPGLVELHTDNVEKNLQPRPGMLWPAPLSAIFGARRSLCRVRHHHSVRLGLRRRVFRCAGPPGISESNGRFRARRHGRGRVPRRPLPAYAL